MPRQKTHARRSRRRRYEWESLSDEELLDTRLCDLKLRIEGSPLEDRVAQLRDELTRSGIRFRPPVWLSDEWFCPYDIPGIGIPFYLAHPRLMRLEARHMYEVEGGTRTTCMQLLRHEAGHALEAAYRLHRRKRWRALFGNARKPYPDYYSPKPFSRRYVLHLDWWYAQSHPSEDFAETFAVWLRPGSQWRRRYQGWYALRKLEYVDQLMDEIGSRKPLVTSRRRVDSIAKLRYTIREYFERKKDRYGAEYPDFYDRDLRRLFEGSSGAGGRRHTAAAFLRRYGPEIRKLVARWTGESAYTIDLVLKEMITRCRELNLKIGRDLESLKLELAVLLTMQTMNYVHSEDHRLPI